MELLTDLFGHGEHLSVMQMCARTVLIFLVCLVLIRISGRRSFGMRMPLDNVITILLGAILSRAVVGASPLVATLVSATAIAVLHRIFGWLGFYSKFFGRLVKGEALVLYKNGQMQKRNMLRAMATHEDMLEGIRICSNLRAPEETESIYMERNGQISVVKKKQTA